MKEPKLIEWGYAGYTKYLNGLQARYRLNNQSFQKLWDAQGGRCAGCLMDFAHPWLKGGKYGLEPLIDYRKTGEETQGSGNKCELVDVRGLLCRRCKHLITTLDEARAQMQNLTEYLKRYEVTRGKQ